MEFTGIWGSIITPRHVVWVARTASWPEKSQLWICWFNKSNLEKPGICRVVDAGGLANARKDRRTWKDSNFALMVLPNHQEAKDHCLFVQMIYNICYFPQHVPFNLLLSQTWVLWKPSGFCLFQIISWLRSASKTEAIETKPRPFNMEAKNPPQLKKKTIFQNLSNIFHFWLPS